MIKLIKSTFYQEKKSKQKLIKFIKSADILSFGKQCQNFENNFAHWQNRKHCIFLNSGSSADLAIIQALLNLGKIKQGDFVGFSALTWSTNVMSIIELGLKAIPVDVELDTLNVSSHTLVAVLKKYPIKLLFLTNLLGFCDDIDMIKKICLQKKILLIEDNCESIGTEYKGTKLGNFGFASTFSFYVGHHLSTIEGGAVCTNDDRLAVMLKIVRAHGWDRNLDLYHQNKIRHKYKINSTFYSRYTFYDLGYNFRPTEINGYLGNIQLKYLEEIIAKRENNFLRLAKALYARSSYYPIRYNHLDRISNFAIPIICKTKKIRDNLVKKCEGKVEIRPVVAGDMTKQPFFLKYMGHFLKTFRSAHANLIHEQGLYFGNNPELTNKEMSILMNIF